MNRMNSALRNIAVLITLVVLALAVFWLVSRQIEPEPQPVAQATAVVPTTDLPTPSTIAPQSITEPTLSPMVEPTRTPYTPEYVVATGYPITPPPPTTPTPTPTFEPLTGQAIGGYVFSEARLVPGTLGSYIELVEWLPDDPNKILVVRDKKSLEVIDIDTGETRLYSDGKTRVRNPVWLPARRAAAYLTSDEDDYTKQYLWINDGENSELVFTTAWVSPLAVTPDGSGVILFDENWQLTQVGSLNTQDVKLAVNTQAYTPPGYNHGELYQVAQSPDRRKALYFNDEWVLLADFVTGSITPIDLASLRTEDMPPIATVRLATWSLSGIDLALVASTGIGYTGNLFVLDTQTQNLRFVETMVSHVGDLTWASDNSQIMIFPTTKFHDQGYGIGTLYLIDSLRNNLKPIAALPNDAIISAIKGLQWSLAGTHIAVVFSIEPEVPGLYIIEVNNE